MRETTTEPRTCKMCSERVFAPICNRIGWVDFDDIDTPDDDGMIFADSCIWWKEKNEPDFDQRYERLEQVAREMFCEYRLVIPILASHIGVDYVTRNFVMPDVFIKKLRELGVSVDDM